MPRIRLHRIVIFLLAFFIGVPVSAQSGNPPPADQVFSLTASCSTEGGLQLDWRIASGDYLYRDKIAAKTAAGESVAITTPPGSKTIRHSEPRKSITTMSKPTSPPLICRRDKLS